MKPARPAHLVAIPGGRSLCGVARPVPSVTVEAAPRHVAGYGLALCPDCVIAGSTQLTLDL